MWVNTTQQPKGRNCDMNNNIDESQMLVLSEKGQTKKVLIPFHETQEKDNYRDRKQINVCQVGREENWLQKAMREFLEVMEMP